MITVMMITYIKQLSVIMSLIMLCDEFFLLCSVKAFVHRSQGTLLYIYFL